MTSGTGVEPPARPVVVLALDCRELYAQTETIFSGVPGLLESLDPGFFITEIAEVIISEGKNYDITSVLDAVSCEIEDCLTTGMPLAWVNEDPTQELLWETIDKALNMTLGVLLSKLMLVMGNYYQNPDWNLLWEYSFTDGRNLYLKAFQDLS